jgi:hypothetical protein
LSHVARCQFLFQDAPCCLPGELALKSGSSGGAQPFPRTAVGQEAEHGICEAVRIIFDPYVATVPRG